MRILKSLVGWASLMLLLAAVVFAVSWVYMSAQPWLAGAAFYSLPPPDITAMARLLSKDHIGRSDSQTLRELANREVQPQRMRTGWDAFAWSWGYQRIPVVKKPTSLMAAAVLDANGRVVAAHPPGLIGQVFPFNHSLVETVDSGGPDPTPAFVPYPYWSGIFSQTVARMVNEPFAGRGVYMERIRNPRGQVIAVLAIVSRDEVVVPGAGFVPSDILRGHSRYAYTALISLFLHWVLLIAWVALDAGWRGMRPFAWGTLTLLTGWVGLGAYLMARLPAPGECPNCGERILSKYVRCPCCGVSLMTICPVCRARGKPGWQFCPVCGAAPPQPSQGATPSPAPRARSETGLAALQVSVLDAESGAPVQNARISVNGPSFREGFTGARGVFDAQRLRAGKYTVTASRPGHESASAELELCEDSAEVVELRLKAQPGRIVGRVVERATGRPMAGVTVSLESGRLERSVVTGSEGGFVLEDMPGGPYTVRAEAEGFAPQVKLAEVPPGQQAALDFALECTQGIGAEAPAGEETTNAGQ